MGLAFNGTRTVWLQIPHHSCLLIDILSPLQGEPGKHIDFMNLIKPRFMGKKKEMLALINERIWNFLWVTLNFRSQGSLKDINLCPSPLSEQETRGSSWRACLRVFMPLTVPAGPSPSLAREEEVCDPARPSGISIIQLVTTFLSRPCSSPESHMYLAVCPSVQRHPSPPTLGSDFPPDRHVSSL